MVDFPFGAGTTEARVDAIKRYSQYTDELDIVAPIGLIKSGLWGGEVEHDITRWLRLPIGRVRSLR